MLLLVMLVVLLLTTQSPLKVEFTTDLVLGSNVVKLVTAQRATGLPASHELGEILSIKILEETQHEQGLATVLV
jgi:hypothetical protein